MTIWYILNEDKTTRPADDTPEDKDLVYATLERGDKIVAQEHVGEFFVSTVFLGLDHRFWREGPPILFETLVFDKDGHGGEMNRYCTWQEAEAGHKRMVNNLTSGKTREELEAAKALIEPLLAQQVTCAEQGSGSEQPQESVDHDDRQDHHKDYINDLAD